MDLGVVGLDGLVCSDSGCAASLFSDPETKQKWFGSGGFLKQERPGTCADDWRDLKVAKTTDDFSASKALLLQLRSPLLRPNTTLLPGGQQMLSFSLPNSQTATLSNYHQTSAANCRNTGYGSGGLNAATLYGVLAGVRGPFTPSQRMELEHQALIYKYISSNMQIPSHLLSPIRKALDSAGFSSFSGLSPNPLGWGAFHLGFSSNSDPEPGRCRRTDGKKWRCSKDAVPDQKYCERHMNRGRHRSRKPVEGHTGHSVTRPTTTTIANLMPISSLTSTSMVPSGSISNSLSLPQPHQLSNLQSGAPDPPASPGLNRVLLNKENVGKGIENTSFSVLSGLKENQLSITKQQNSHEEPSQSEFRLVCSNSLPNSLHKNPCHSFEVRNGRETKAQHSLLQFMDEWPKNQTERSTISWPSVDQQSDRTQLSISIPTASSDVMSSTASPANKTLASLPLSLSHEHEQNRRDLGVNTILNEEKQRQENWIPISWGTSMGGPLGEVFQSTNNSTGVCKNTSALNLMTEGWDNSPKLASSPTGVLQKTGFGSLSNSSAVSSPRTNSKTVEGMGILG